MRKILAVILLVLSSQVNANEGLYLLVGLGKSDIDIKPEYQVNNTNESNENFDFQFSLGYQFKSNILMEGGFVSHGSLDIVGLGDHSSVSENMLLVGYSFDITERFSIIPRAGYSWWTLESTEGILFNPGAEKQNTIKDENFTYMLSASYRFLYLTYQATNFDFGSVNSLVLGVNIDF